MISALYAVGFAYLIILFLWIFYKIDKRGDR